MEENCKHIYSSDHDWCPMPASPGSDFCIWHNRDLNKSDAYVASLLENLLDFIQGDLTEFHLAELDWPGAQLSHKVLEGADLRDAHLPRAQLVESTLRNANLRRCNLRKANLHGANLQGCDLKHTDLSGANLSEANLSGAQLSDTNLMNANLSGAILSDVIVESFRWNENTNFEGVRGLDAQQSDSDETQAFITPVALLNYQREKNSSSTLSNNAHIVQTHEYRNASSVTADALSKLAGAIKTQSIEKKSEQFTRPVPITKPLSKKDAAPYKRRIRLLYLVNAAAILVAVGACYFGVWSYQQLQERPTIIKERIVTKEIMVENPDTPEATETKEYKQLFKQQKQLVAENKALTESYRQFEVRSQKIEQEKIDLKVAVRRLELRNDEVEHQLVEFQKLKNKYQALKRHASRLNDTASILAKGVDRLSIENEQLNEVKNKRLNAQSQLDLLQTKSLQLQHENDQLKKDNTEIKEYNQSLLAELTTARKSLERFLSRIEGSRLHAFLTKDATQLKAIAIEPSKPIVLSGDDLITLEINQAKKSGYVESKLFVQRGAQGQIPDVNVIFYNANMQALRSISYGFPNSDSKETFAVSSANFNSPSFPSFVRILVNPGVEDELVASHNSNGGVR